QQELQAPLPRSQIERRHGGQIRLCADLARSLNRGDRIGLKARKPEIEHPPQQFCGLKPTADAVVASADISNRIADPARGALPGLKMKRFGLAAVSCEPGDLEPRFGCELVLDLLAVHRIGAADFD